MEISQSKKHPQKNSYQVCFCDLVTTQKTTQNVQGEKAVASKPGYTAGGLFLSRGSLHIKLSVILSGFTSTDGY